MTTRESISTQQKVAGNFVLALGTSVWATHFLVTDYLLQNWDPYFVTAGRLLSATFFLMTAYTLQARGRPLRRIPWRPTLMLSTAGIAVSTVLPDPRRQACRPGVRLDRRGDGADRGRVRGARGFSGRVWALPSSSARWSRVAGGVVAALGTRAGGIEEWRGGEFFILAAVTLFTWYSIGAQRWLTGLSQLGISAITIMTGGLTLLAALPILVGLGIAEVRFQLDTRSVLSVLYLGAGPASFALFTWHWGISRVGVTIASIYSNLAPVVVVLIRMIQGEPPTSFHLVGGALIIAGGPLRTASSRPRGRARGAESQGVVWRPRARRRGSNRPNRGGSMGTTDRPPAECAPGGPRRHRPQPRRGAAHYRLRSESLRRAQGGRLRVRARAGGGDRWSQAART